ncbi:hypothetical protein [Klebsiella quasipneumoniae]|nr:hypothetical protein [Klebsiella quasipneumoniae]
MFEKGQAHRADLTTSRIDDGSREPEMKKATQMRSLVGIILLKNNV